MTSTPIHDLVWLLAAAVVLAVLLAGWSAVRAASDTDERERTQSCVCGHAQGFHEHLHSRTYCAFGDGCTRFRAVDVHRARSTDLPFNVTDYVKEANADDFDAWDREVAS